MNDTPDTVAAGAPVWPLWLSLGALLGLALIVFLPAALDARFVNLDDPFFFGPTSVFRTGGLAIALEQPIANAYLPVAHGSLWFDYWLFANAPTGPHVVAVLLHGLVGVVLARLFGALSVRPVPAHLAAALFVVHPALAESVTWVSGRKDLLAGLFGFLALLFVVRHAQRGGGWRLLVVAVCTALAMYSKATAVVLPLLAVLFTWVTATGPRRFLAPALMLVVVLPIALHHQSIAAAEGTLASGSFGERAQQVPGAFAHYLLTAIWPLHLNVLYPEIQTLELFVERLWLGLLTVVAVLVGAVVLLLAKGRASRLVGIGLLAFAVALLPFNTAWPASSIAAADRYLHLALPGLALGFALLLTRGVGGSRTRPIGAAAIAVLLLPLGYLAQQRADDFTTTEKLWRSSLAEDPDNAVAHFNLASELLGRGVVDAEGLIAIETELQAAVDAARYPIHELRAARLLRVLALRQGDYEAAAEHARTAVRAAGEQLEREVTPQRREQAESLLVETLLESFEALRLAGYDVAARTNWVTAKELVPEHPEVVAFGSLLELGTAVEELVGRTSDAAAVTTLAIDAVPVQAAITALETALTAHPEHPSLLFALASWHRACGETLPALRYYKKAEKGAPDRVDSFREAARMLREQGLYTEAIKHAQNGLQGREDPALRQEWALSLIGLGRLDEAVMQLEAYLRARPTDEDTKKILASVLVGRALVRLNEAAGTVEGHKEALRIIDQVLELNPNEQKAHLVLGRIARENGQYLRAVQYYDRAYELLPTYADARLGLAEALRDLGMERMLRKDDPGAAEAWLRCLEVAPKNFDKAALTLQLKGLWRRCENRGIEFLKAGDKDAAIAEFRRCLQVDPEQHWISWLLANALRDRPDVDLAELERLCRQAVDWQRKHELDSSRQTYLLADTLARRGNPQGARDLARAWLEDDRNDREAADPAALGALEILAQ